MIMADGCFEHRQTVGIALGTDIEDVEKVGRELVLGDSCHRDDTGAQDVLRRLLTLFGVIPKDVQPFWLDPFDGEHLTAETEGHQDGRDKRLAALGLTTQRYQLATRETGLVEEPEEELHLGQLLGRGDASLL